MKVKFLILVCVLVVIFVVAGCAPTKAPAPKAAVPAGYGSIRMTGSTLGGAASVAVMALATVFNKYYPEIEWSSCSGAPAATVVYITKGSQIMGCCMFSHYVTAYGFDKIPESRVRSIIQPLAASNYLFAIPEDKPWKDITQVPKGINLSPGTPGAPSTACEAWIELCGLSKKDFNWMPMGQQEVADAWAAGKLDVAFLSVSGMAPALMTMQTSPRRIKPVGLSPEQAAKAKAGQTFERLGFSGVGKSNITEIVGEIFKYDVDCVMMPVFVNCRDDFPEEIAYRMAKVIDEHGAELVQIYSAMKFATPQQHIQSAKPPMDIHAGVAKYYREKGYLK